MSTPIGLPNNGSSCYINAALQALYHTTFLKYNIRELFDNLDAFKLNIIDDPDKIDFTEQLITIISLLFHHMDAHNPNQRIDNENMIKNSKADLMNLLTTHKCLFSMTKSRIYLGFNPNTQDDASSVVKFLLEMMDGSFIHLPWRSNKDSVLNLITFSFTRCQTCNRFIRIGNKFGICESLGVLLLRINKAMTEINIENLLRNYESEEVIESTETCNCGSKNIIKTTFFQVFPKLLVILLGRFDCSDPTNPQKIKTPSKAPLKMTISNPRGLNGCTYVLTSIIYHIEGYGGGGHYTAECLHEMPDNTRKWIFFNDSSASDSEYIDRSYIGEPYMYFYELIN
jgi:uncharacterized UBP type Zn finger protein